MATESIRELWRDRDKESEVEQSSNQSQQHERRYTKRLQVQVQLPLEVAPIVSQEAHFEGRDLVATIQKEFVSPDRIMLIERPQSVVEIVAPTSGGRLGTGYEIGAVLSLLGIEEQPRSYSSSQTQRH